MDLYGVEAEAADFAGGGEHVGVGFAGEAEHDVGTDFEASAAAAVQGVEHGVVVVAAVHPVERAVVDGLHAVFDGDVGARREFV